MTPCKNWGGYILPNGYGQFWDKERKQNVLVHRFFFEKLVGPIPDGMQVCHHCDNKRCINVDHLFLGTQSDNMRDCVKKGRWKNNWPHHLGEKHPSAKLTQKQVEDIRTRYSAGGTTLKELAKEFGVCFQTISWITTRGTWNYGGVRR